VGVLTSAMEGDGRRCTSRAVMNNGGEQWCSTRAVLESGGRDLGAGMNAVKAGGARGALYIGWGGEVRGRGRRPAGGGVRHQWPWVRQFLVAEEGIGEGKRKERGDQKRKGRGRTPGRAVARGTQRGGAAYRAAALISCLEDEGSLGHWTERLVGR
jgi:hypothetical protein